MQKILLLIFLVGSSLVLKSEESTKDNLGNKTNCKIIVESVAKSGESSQQIFHLVQKDKAACEKAAAVHKNNFAPNYIVKKTVTVEWTGSEN